MPAHATLGAQLAMASRWHAYMPPRQPPRCVPLLLPPRSKAVELAALPDVSPEQRRRMLQFVICGGGPTGVETAAELMDLVSEDLAFHMPHIKVRRAVQSGGRGGARRVEGRTCVHNCTLVTQGGVRTGGCPRHRQIPAALKTQV